MRKDNYTCTIHPKDQWMYVTGYWWKKNGKRTWISMEDDKPHDDLKGLVDGTMRLMREWVASMDDQKKAKHAAMSQVG